jgi:hypothetical protein
MNVARRRRRPGLPDYRLYGAVYALCLVSVLVPAHPWVIAVPVLLVGVWGLWRWWYAPRRLHAAFVALEQAERRASTE